jgi:hypothetical protein
MNRSSRAHSQALPEEHHESLASVMEESQVNVARNSIVAERHPHRRLLAFERDV